MSAIRYSFGGDEHVFAEIGEEMSLEAFFKGMAICTELEKRRIAALSRRSHPCMDIRTESVPAAGTRFPL